MHQEPPSRSVGGDICQDELESMFKQVCEEAAKEHCLVALRATAEDLGEVLAGEVADVARDLAAAVGIKSLEQIRCLAAVLSVPLCEAAAPRDSSDGRAGR